MKLSLNYQIILSMNIIDPKLKKSNFEIVAIDRLFILFYYQVIFTIKIALLAGTVEYPDCFSAKG